jgi:hypothetical protein
MVKPASCRTETIPPEYKTVKQMVTVKPGEWKCTPVPAQYKTVMRRKMVAPCRWEWRRNTDCEVPTEAAVAEGDADGFVDVPDRADELGTPPAGE